VIEHDSRLKTKWELVRFELDEVSRLYSEMDRAFGKAQYEMRMLVALAVQERELSAIESNELDEFRRWLLENHQDMQLHEDAFNAHVKLYVEQMERMTKNDKGN
jgi:hypothetical protein